MFRSYKYGGIVDDAVWSNHMETIWGEKSAKDMLDIAQKQAEDYIEQQN